MAKLRDYPSFKNPIYLLKTQISNMNFKKLNYRAQYVKYDTVMKLELGRK